MWTTERASYLLVTYLFDRKCSSACRDRPVTSPHLHHSRFCRCSGLASSVYRRSPSRRLPWTCSDRCFCRLSPSCVFPRRLSAHEGRGRERESVTYGLLPERGSNCANQSFITSTSFRRISSPARKRRQGRLQPHAIDGRDQAVEGNGLGEVLLSAKKQFGKLDGMWGRFMPMAILFFLMAFVNTIIDSLKDSLVITAVGGGTQVLPYLSVYAVLPSSVVFLVLYSWGTRRFSREKLFNIIVLTFMSFYGAFALAYPYHETLHLSGWADNLVTKLPIGLGGLVGMIRNWTFTLFYCTAELWGDVVLSLLFWGLANETTSIEDAPLLYPLFGVGANLAQTVAGRFLRLFSDAAGVHLSYSLQLQSTVALCVALGCIVMALQTFISRTFPKNPKGSMFRLKKSAETEQKVASPDDLENERTDIDWECTARDEHVMLDLEASVAGLNYCDVDEHSREMKKMNKKDAVMRLSSNGSIENTMKTSNGNSNTRSDLNACERGRNGARNSAIAGTGHSVESMEASSSTASSSSSMSLVDAWQFLSHSPQMRCLAIMALAQGVTTRLLEVSWKHYLHQLHATPAAYAAFLGDTAMWTGIVTGCLMFSSPLLFDQWGWKGVASATPKFMLWFGVPFFMGCIAYNVLCQGALASGALTLQILVIAGAILQVFSRGAKFSLFKPAEEMVYIGLDDESRTKGKAAIDVVGAQSGKSVGSILQQVLLIISGGTVGGIVPLLAVFYAVMLRQWTRSVKNLAEHYDPAHVHRVSVMGSLDEDNDMQYQNFSNRPDGNGIGTAEHLSISSS